MPDVLTIGQLADRLSAKYGVPLAPKRLSDGFYARQFPLAEVVVIGGRRLIAESSVAYIETVLRRMGALPHLPVEAAR